MFVTVDLYVLTVCVVCLLQWALCVCDSRCFMFVTVNLYVCDSVCCVFVTVDAVCL